VSTNPEPKHTVSYVSAERAISQPDANRPLATNLLEMERWVPWIVLQNLVVAASERTWISIGSSSNASQNSGEV
jgi:hypothetical protein